MNQECYQIGQKSICLTTDRRRNASNRWPCLLSAFGARSANWILAKMSFLVRLYQQAVVSRILQPKQEKQHPGNFYSTSANPLRKELVVVLCQIYAPPAWKVTFSKHMRIRIYQPRMQVFVFDREVLKVATTPRSPCCSPEELILSFWPLLLTGFVF